MSSESVRKNAGNCPLAVAGITVAACALLTQSLPATAASQPVADASNPAYRSWTPPPPPEHKSGWYAGLSAGYAFFLKPGKSTVTTTGSTAGDIYSPDSTNGGPAVVLEGGYAWKRDTTWWPGLSVGLAGQYSQGKVKGSITQYSLPQFKNYNYKYNVNQSMIMAKVTLDIVKYGIWSLYGTGGGGGSYNRASGYEESALPGVTPRDSMAFSPRNSWSWAYMTGVGMRFRVTDSLYLKAEYDYVDAGKAKFGTGAVRPGVNGPDTRLRSNYLLGGVELFW